MKQRMSGLIVLILVILGAAGYLLWQRQAPKPVTQINGYLGGEKIGVYEDEEIKKLIEDRYRLKLDYRKAGSLDMITADLTGMDYLFPSSVTAQELYVKVHGKPPQAEMIFNTPIVLYSHRKIADVFVSQGLASVNNGVYTVDIKKLTEIMEKDTKWADIGIPELWGPVTVGTTDPTKSNSGNMFAGLLANMINGGNVVNMTTVDTVNPRLKTLFSKLGYMEHSSADLFSQYLQIGIGGKPIVAGYENQMLEFAAQHPDEWSKLSSNLVIMYPVPTVWSTHIYIALDDEGKKGIEALKDTSVQELAWKKHGFRTGIPGISQDPSIFGVPGVMPDITQVIPMPDVDTMEKIISNFAN